MINDMILDDILLLLTIIVNSKNWMIIIAKENIMVNRQSYILTNLYYPDSNSQASPFTGWII